MADDAPSTITAMGCSLHRVPPATRWEDATHRVSALEFVVVSLETASGASGVGYAYTVGVGGTAIKALLTDYCAGVVVGLDVARPEGLGAVLRAHLHRTGSGGLNTLAAAAIDTAAWDALGKIRGRPVSELLGGHSASLPAYASGIDLAMTPAELEEHLDALVTRGYEAVKIKVGLPRIADDVQRVAVARRVLGPDRTLLLDVNQRWHADEAPGRLRRLAPYDPGWIEEPLAAEDIEGHARLRRTTDIPIAVGESLYTPQQFLAYLRAAAVDILQPDVARVGGFTGWRTIAALAAAWERRVSAHYAAELSVHAMCAIPNALWVEDVVGGSMAELELTAQHVVEHGIARPPAGPGLGLRLHANRLRDTQITGALHVTDVRTAKHTIHPVPTGG